MSTPRREKNGEQKRRRGSASFHPPCVVRKVKDNKKTMMDCVVGESSSEMSSTYRLKVALIDNTELLI
jgi:hypothetical protein